ncbi:alpha/beta fold hydrolase [Metabacillus malikii]|nr:alpha/beta fold hydrolase [Metabacillus malikii]
MSDGHEVFIKSWGEEIKTPRAIVQLSHGMAEHIKRYDYVAEKLVSENIVVIGNDHRGHGETGRNSGKLGFIAEENGFERIVLDVKELNEHIHHKYPTVPVFLLGHSMGSFLARRFIQRFHGQVNGVIIVGTGGNPGILGKIGKTLAAVQKRKHGSQMESPFMNKLIFGSYNKQFPDQQTSFDWLTRDKNEVSKYLDDEFCGFVATTSFYYDLLEGLEIIHRNQEVAKIDKNLPIFFVSGAKDPVGKASKGVSDVIEQYKRYQISNIEYKFYDEARHEILNELNRDEVIQDILSWLNKQLLHLNNY